MKVQLHQLAYFLAVAETRHFTRAAERVRVAQPSLSKQIQGLERELGAELFSRARGNIALTPAGEALLPLARRILADVQTARLEVQELAGLRSGRVRIGSTPSLCTGLLPGVLRHFRERYPGIQLQIAEGGSRDLVGDLAQGSLDLALITLPLRSRDPALTTTPLMRERLVLASASDAPPPVATAEANITDLRDHQLVMFRQGYDVREATLHACRQAGFEPAFAVEGGEMDAVLRFVESGIGVAVVPSMVVDGRPQFRITPFADPALSRTIALAHRTDVQLTRAAHQFRTELVRTLADSALTGHLPLGTEMITDPADLA